MSPNPVSGAIDFSLADAQAMGNELISRIGAMREADPIYRSRANGGIWMVTGHREVADGFAGKVPLSAVRLPDMVVGALPAAERMAKIPYLMTSTRHWMVNMDRPAQWRLRNLAQKAFSAPAVELLRPRVRAAAAAAFDRVAAQERIELVGDVARPIAGATILSLLDLPDALLPRLHDWSVAANAALTTFNMPEEVLVAGERTLLEMREVFMLEIDRRKATPDGGFISSLVTARDAEGDRLADEEILGILYLALIAGQDTSTNTIALGTAALAGLPEARAYLRADASRIGNVVAEIGRYVAMSTLQGRIASADFDWNGHAIRRGDLVFLVIAGANRDPAVFARPDNFDAERPNTKAMTFAPGIHFCIGHYLATMQLQEYFGALIARYDPVLLDDRLQFGMALSFRGVDTLHVRLDPRRD